MVVRLPVVLLALALFWMPVAFAEPVSYPEPVDPLPWNANRTYGDLVRLVVPGIDGGSATASGSGVIDVRHIDGADVSGPESVSIETLRIAAIPVRSAGLDRVALLLDLGETEDDVSNFVILALFDVADEPRLLDAANVAFDRYTSFLEPALLPVGIGDDLLAIRSTHFNSSQSYATTVLILARDDRLELVDTIFTFDDRTAAYERTQRLDIRHGAGEPFSDIMVAVTELTVATQEERKDAVLPESGSRIIAVTYRWDAAAHRYIPDSDAFDALARDNEQRF